MPATPIYALPYPAATDPADVPADTKRLADRTEVVLGKRGLGTVTWPGGSATSNTLVIPHGLGTLPAAVVATAKTQAGTGAVMIVCDYDSVNIAVILIAHNTNPLSNATTLVSWVAFP